jgi:hypothetical protein
MARVRAGSLLTALLTPLESTDTILDRLQRHRVGARIDRNSLYTGRAAAILRQSGRRIQERRQRQSG